VTRSRRPSRCSRCANSATNSGLPPVALRSAALTRPQAGPR
jgi:hypothetical protein